MTKLAKQTHKDRVHEFNEKLESLSEHHDIPKVSLTSSLVENFSLLCGLLGWTRLTRRVQVLVSLLLYSPPLQLNTLHLHLNALYNLFADNTMCLNISLALDQTLWDVVCRVWKEISSGLTHELPT